MRGENNTYSYDYRYINGNYLVTYFNYRSTLVKEAFREGEELISEFPDSIDLKITNKCSTGCPFCHESSTPDGKTFDLEKTITVLEQLPRLPIEIAIGGGNVLDVIPEATQLVDWLISRGHRVRATINYKDILNLNSEQRKFLSKFEGLGISINSLDDKFLDFLNAINVPSWITDERSMSKYIQNLIKQEGDDYYEGILVFHVIAGVIPLNELDLLVNKGNLPILILGFKQWGRAKNKHLPGSITDFESWVKQYIFNNRYNLFDNDRLIKPTISFDNLALNQLHIKDSLLEEEWSRIFMGEEGQHSMYIDAVNGEFAKNSTSPDRVSWNDIGLIEFFKNL